MQLHNWLLIILGILVVFGLIMVTAASHVLSDKLFGSPFIFLKNQLLLGVGLGALGFLIMAKVNYRLWKKLALPILLVSIFLLALVFVPELSYSYGGASRWLQIGPVSFQPSEFAKLALIIYLAAWLENKKNRLNSPTQGLLPFLVIVGIVGLLILLEPDISTLLILAATAGIIFLSAGGRWSHVIVFAVLAGIVAATAIAFSPTRLERVQTFTDPGADPLDASYQINQSLIALGSGGLIGKGIGGSTQKYFYLPEPAGDSIFAIIGEETGFIGTTLLILMFLALGLVGFLAGIRAPDEFGKLIALGFTGLTLTQAFLNMSAVTGLLPTTGIVLPFISYGGSAMITFLAGAGLVYNIAKTSN